MRQVGNCTDSLDLSAHTSAKADVQPSQIDSGRDRQTRDTKRDLCSAVEDLDAPCRTPDQGNSKAGLCSTLSGPEAQLDRGLAPFVGRRKVQLLSDLTSSTVCKTRLRALPALYCRLRLCQASPQSRSRTPPSDHATRRDVLRRAEASTSTPTSQQRAAIPPKSSATSSGRKNTAQLSRSGGASLDGRKESGKRLGALGPAPQRTKRYKPGTVALRETLKY